MTAELGSQQWLKIGADDWRQVLSYRCENGVVCYDLTPSRLGLAERQRARRGPRPDADAPATEVA